MPEDDVIWEVPPSKEGLDGLKNYCPDLTIIDTSIHDYEERADGTIVETHVEGIENVRRYLEKVKNAIDKVPPSEDKHAFIDPETGKITPINPSDKPDKPL